MSIKVKKFLIWIIERLLNPLILWSFGWKRKRKTHKLHDISILSYPVWQDPNYPDRYYEESDAIIICEGRI